MQIQTFQQHKYKFRYYSSRLTYHNRNASSRLNIGNVNIFRNDLNKLLHSLIAKMIKNNTVLIISITSPW